MTRKNFVKIIKIKGTSVRSKTSYFKTAISIKKTPETNIAPIIKSSHP